MDRVVGFTTSPADGAAAVKAGAVTDLLRSAEAVARAAQLVVLAVPPAATVALVEELATVLAECGVLATDVASIKLPIVRRAEALALSDRFAGSHPFAGTHQSGFAGARPERFADALVYVTPLAGGEDAAREVADFWTRVFGAHPVMMDAARHDEILAWTSHLPQAAASAVAATLARRGPQGVTYGTGAESTTRLAASGAEMWADVLLMNREPVMAALEALGDELAQLRDALLAGDAEAVRAWLERGAEWRARYER